MLTTLRTGRTALFDTWGYDLWEHYRRHPEQWAVFNEAMRTMNGPMTPAVTAAYDWARFPAIADVGGGIGARPAGAGIEMLLRISTRMKGRESARGAPNRRRQQNDPPSGAIFDACRPRELQEYFDNGRRPPPVDVPPAAAKGSLFGERLRCAGVPARLRRPFERMITSLIIHYPRWQAARATPALPVKPMLGHPDRRPTSGLPECGQREPTLPPAYRHRIRS